MPYLSILFGALLIALGAEAYTNYFEIFHVQHLHAPTALIPAYFGIALVLCGWVELGPAMFKWGMETAAVIALVGFIASGIRGFPKLSGVLRGDVQIENPAAVKIQSLMAALCGIFFLLCVRSFIVERKHEGHAPPEPVTPPSN
ncbi:MAG: hypothetical protein ACJ8C4_16030 [Gemmataceae bacterium]